MIARLTWPLIAVTVLVAIVCNITGHNTAADAFGIVAAVAFFLALAGGGE